jgi:threonine dehydratase
LNEITGFELYFKCENFQKAGAFKFRGATNAVFSLSERLAKRGVLTHSSGNHAGALSLAAKMRQIPAYIIMPKHAPDVKKAAVQHYGGIITECEPTLEAREKTAKIVLKKTGARFIHPYNNEEIIAGQGTLTLELLRQKNDLDLILVPVGGGGLISGTAICAKSLCPKIQIFGCEPQNADDAYRSFYAGKIIPVKNPNTIADGLRSSLGDKTFPIIRSLVDDIFLVTESEIITAMRYVWERMKIIVEPSAVVPFAAVLKNRKEFIGKKIALILSGGNVDVKNLTF